jgi:hypothetical protein
MPIRIIKLTTPDGRFDLRKFLHGSLHTQTGPHSPQGVIVLICFRKDYQQCIPGKFDQIPARFADDRDHRGKIFVNCLSRVSAALAPLRSVCLHQFGEPRQVGEHHRAILPLGPDIAQVSAN